MPVWLKCRLRYSVVLLPSIRSVTQRILAAARHSEASVSLDFIGDDRMRRLNRQYRQRDSTTDVLAFAMREASGPPSHLPHLLGDVVISLHMAARQAVTSDISLDEEVVRLIIHGVLHLVGYDHERGEREARRMLREEETILRALEPLPRLIANRKR